MNEEQLRNLGIIGKSKEIQDLVEIASLVAKSEISVLIYGESGVGKEIFARAIHKLSNRANEKLVSVNCGAIPEGILESELFGHKKGSFTGAVNDRKGYFEIASKGILFLDEIAEMPLTTQVKLLRVLETSEIMKVGSETVTKVDVRIIAATNKDLQKEVDAKRFRKDLYFRLKAVSLNIPPLRQRVEDIRALSEYFLSEYIKKNERPEQTLTPKAIDFLTTFSWPGNIRELKNTIETASALSRGELISDALLKTLVTQPEYDYDNRNLPIRLNKSPESIDRDMIIGALIEIKKDLIDLKQIAYQTDQEFTSHTNNNEKEVLPLQEVEKIAIINALNYTKGNKRKAAQLLNISERTLYRKIKEYDVQ